MEEVAEDGKESTNSAHANGMRMNGTVCCMLFVLNWYNGLAGTNSKFLSCLLI
jgi:hypothetical protein